MIDLSSVQIVPRAGWNADANRGEYEPHVLRRIVVHHTYQPTAADYLAHKRDQDRVLMIKRIQRYHMLDRGWSDIGYHFLIGPDGVIFEGRPIDVIGSHCGGVPPAGVRRIFGNTGSIGICLIGNYDSEIPDDRMLDAFETLKAAINKGCGNILPVFGHFQAWSKPPKTCPGKNLVGKIGIIGLEKIWKDDFPGK